MKRRNILFVCSANTCRSPAAEAILTEYGADRYETASAGLFAREGEPMMDKVAEELAAMFHHPVSALRFLSKHLNNDMMTVYDEIVAVSEPYAKMLATAYPFCADKVRAFPHPIPDFSVLSGDALTEALTLLRNQIFEMYQL